MGIARLGAALLAILSVTPCAAQLLNCLAHPVEPPCCPSPCPIGDIKRLPELSSAVSALQQLVALEQQTADTARMVQQTVGMAASLPADYASAVIQAARNFTQMPAALTGLPADAAQAVKQSMFTAPGVIFSSSQLATLRQNRAMANGQEQVAALAAGIQHIGALPSIPPIVAPAAATAAQSATLRGDSATAGGARLALLADVASLAKLWAASTSLASSAAARIYGETAPPASAAPSASIEASAPTAAPLAATIDNLPVQQRAAQSILASYPALQDTIASAQAAQLMANNAAQTLQTVLPNPDSLTAVQALLRNLDGTGWQDSATKDQTASAAPTKVAMAILLSQSGSSAFDPQTLSQAMSAWLAADKQNRYWQSLAASAGTSIAALDRRLGEISDSLGFDITSIKP